jgi:hemolysin III
MGLGLLVATPTAGLRLSVAVYVATTVLLFGVSASYHLGAGGPRTNTFLNRLDHANITCSPQAPTRPSPLRWPSAAPA